MQKGGEARAMKKCVQDWCKRSAFTASFDGWYRFRWANAEKLSENATWSAFLTKSNWLFSSDWPSNASARQWSEADALATSRSPDSARHNWSPQNRARTSLAAKISLSYPPDRRRRHRRPSCTGTKTKGRNIDDTKLEFTARACG